MKYVDIAIEQHRKRRKLYHEFCRFYTKSDEIFARAKWKVPTRVSCLPDDTVSMLSFMPLSFYKMLLLTSLVPSAFTAFCTPQVGVRKSGKSRNRRIGLKNIHPLPQTKYMSILSPLFGVSFDSVTVKAASGAQQTMNVDKYC